MGVMDTWAMVVSRVGSSSFASLSEIPPIRISLEIPQKQMEGWL